MQDKKNLKSNRMKAYFISAAKEIIAIKGVESLSVRNVADSAGYSYATIYNYYKDLDSLLWDVKKSFTEDLIKSISGTRPGQTNQGILNAFKAYAEFFVNNPKLFRFFFQWPLSSQSEHAQETLELFTQVFAMSNTAPAFQSDKGKEATVYKACLYALHGLLLLYFSANGMDIQTFWDDFYLSMNLIIKT